MSNKYIATPKIMARMGDVTGPDDNIIFGNQACMNKVSLIKLQVGLAAMNGHCSRFKQETSIYLNIIRPVHCILIFISILSSWMTHFTLSTLLYKSPSIRTMVTL